MAEGGYYKDRSIEQFLNRAKLANMEKEFKKEKAKKYQGDKWEHRVTIPEEYNLSRSPYKAKSPKSALPESKRSDVIKDVLIDESTPFDEAQKMLHEKLMNMKL